MERRLVKTFGSVLICKLGHYQTFGAIALPFLLG